MIASFIIGAILIIAGISFQKSSQQFGKYGNYVKYVGIFIIALGIFSSIFVQIDPGKVGVKSLFGKVQKGVLPSGLHMMETMPFVFCQMTDWKW